MADYLAYIRSNYFRVKNQESFLHTMSKITSPDLEMLHRDEGDEKQYGFCCVGSLYFENDNDDEAEDSEYGFDDFVIELQGQIVGDGLIIITEIGYELLRYLVGTSTIISKDIVPLGSPEHDLESGNDSDNVHVNFLIMEYSSRRLAEILKRMESLYGKPKRFDDLPLDDVIMAPDMLIRITDIHPETLSELLDCEEHARLYAQQRLLESQKGDGGQ